MCDVALKEVSFRYHNTTVLDSITFSIPASEFVVVVGPNGGGKSTLLKLIAGLLNPNQGTVTIANQSIASARQSALIRYVPQNYGRNTAGFPATVEEIVALGLINNMPKITAAAARHIVDHMLDMVGMGGFRRRRIGELSGGQQQRVMVAMALAGNPQLLLLDEPTSGIDYDASTRIFDLLGTLHRNLGITIVMVSHDIDQAVLRATQVACVNHGLCYYGSSDEFRNSHLEARHLWYYGG
mgnify:CR=1 FL=1